MAVEERMWPLTVDVREAKDAFVLRSDKVEASYRDGVLEVRLPKAEEVKPRETKIELL